MLIKIEWMNKQTFKSNYKITHSIHFGADGVFLAKRPIKYSCARKMINKLLKLVRYAIKIGSV